MSTSHKAVQIRIKRAYEAPATEDGDRVLVDRIWPRGLRREDAHIDLWLKDVAPSTTLRQWFGHDPARWEEFRHRYRVELAHNREPVEQLRTRSRHGTLTLVYSARDEQHNQAVVLRELLMGN